MSVIIIFLISVFFNQSLYSEENYTHQSHDDIELKKDDQEFNYLVEIFKNHPLYPLMKDKTPESAKKREELIQYLENNKVTILWNHRQHTSELQELGKYYRSADLAESPQKQKYIMMLYEKLGPQTQTFVTEKIVEKLIEINKRENLQKPKP